MKLRAERQLLRKQIPINMHPFMHSAVNQGATRMSSYSHPFYYDGQPSSLPHGVKPPLVNDLEQYALSSQSSDYLSLDSSLQGREYFSRKRKRGARTPERSEGEVAALSESSLGEVHFNKDHSDRKEPRSTVAGQLRYTPKHLES